MTAWLGRFRWVLLIVVVVAWAGVSPQASTATCGNDECESGEDCGNCLADCYDVTCYCGDQQCESCEAVSDGVECSQCVQDCGECQDTWDCPNYADCCGAFPEDRVCCEDPFTEVCMSNQCVPIG